MVAAIDSGIGRRIRIGRERQGWSQKELAAAARVPRPWLSTVETGEVENPSAQRLQRLADALAVSTRYLLTGQEDSADEVAERDARWFKALPADIRQFFKSLWPTLSGYAIETRPRTEAHDDAGEETPDSSAEGSAG